MCMCVFLHLCVLRVWTDIHWHKQQGLAPSFGFPHCTWSFPSPECSPVLGAGDAEGSDPVPALQKLPGLASKHRVMCRDGWNCPEEGLARLGKELSLYLEGFLAVAGAITAFIISVSCQQPNREDPAESTLPASQWRS